MIAIKLECYEVEDADKLKAALLAHTVDAFDENTRIVIDSSGNKGPNYVVIELEANY